jgi:hypothetical protein
MPVNSETIKNWTAALQSVAIVVAIIVAGTWRACALHEREQAERALQQQGVVDATLEASQHIAGDGKIVVSALVGLKNAGTRNVVFDWSTAGLTIMRIDKFPLGQPVTALPLSSADFLEVRAGETMTQPYVALIDNPGVYLLSFRIAMPKREVGVSILAGGPERGEYSIASHAFLRVMPDSRAKPSMVTEATKVLQPSTGPKQR